VAGTGAGAFSVSATGTLVYLPNTGVSNQIRSLVWVDREGHEESIHTPPHNFALPRLSPDGSRVALDTRDPDNNDIRIWHFGRRALTRVTTDAAPDWLPVWTPDGTRLVYVSSREGVLNLFWQPVDTPGRAEKLYTTSTAAWPLSFSPDGRVLVFVEGRDLKSLTLTTSESVQTLPDGKRFIAPIAAGESSSDATDTPQINVVLNWFDELKAKAPTGQ
jgi:Tol biopolymer transport system component